MLSCDGRPSLSTGTGFMSVTRRTYRRDRVGFIRI
jgi:hypothetical protein